VVVVALVHLRLLCNAASGRQRVVDESAGGA